MEIEFEILDSFDNFTFKFFLPHIKSSVSFFLNITLIYQKQLEVKCTESNWTILFISRRGVLWNNKAECDPGQSDYFPHYDHHLSGC